MRSVRDDHSTVPLLEALEPRLLLSGNVLVTEFMASNDATLADGEGNYPDWIELHNPTDDPVNLEGWYLTDKSGNLDKWQFPDATPDITIAPGGYMVVFASGQDDGDYPYHDGTYYHTNFSLSKEDENVLLVRPDGLTIEHGYEDYPEQFTDISYGIYLDSNPWNMLVDEGAELSYLVPTAGDAGLLPAGEAEGEQGWTAVEFDDSAWTDAMVFGPAGIIITEISVSDTKFVEIQNASIASVTTTDWTVLVNNGSSGINSVNATGWQLPGSIAAGEVLYRTDNAADNYWGAPIDWAVEGSGWAMVIDDAGEVMDFVGWGYSEAQIDSMDISYGAFPSIIVGGQWSGDGVDITGGGEAGPEENAIELGSTWNYMHPLNATDPAVLDTDFNTTWMEPIGYDGPSFSASGPGFQSGSGPGILGYGGIGMGGVKTHIGEPPGGSRYTAYFRGEFTLSDDMVNVGIEMLSDDGGVVYIDGVEVARNNFSLPRQDTYFEFTNGNGNENGTATISITDLDAGTHTIAASIHQTGTGSSDIGFDLRLFGRPVSGGGLIRRAGSSDGDTESDFHANNDPTKGTRNPGMTVPFGVVTDTIAGIGFSDNQQAFEDIIVTDVGGEMQGVNASLWTRIEFLGSEELSATGTLTLSVMYDDGFVAYLNGVQVARRNAPGTLAWGSTATAVHADALAVAYEEIDITADIGLLRTDMNVLAIHGLNFAASDTDFLLQPKLVAVGDEPVPRHFATATANQVNTELWWRYVEDTSFDHDRGFYTDPFNLAISTDTPGAQIYYTTNGTDPLLNDAGNIHADATLYTSPISITTTTVVRAVAVKAGYDPTNTDTHTYIFLEDVIHQSAAPAGFPDYWGGVLANYEMDPDVINHPTYSATIMDDLRAIPTLSIVTSLDDMFGPNGIYTNSGGRGIYWERPTSVEWVNTDGTTGFQVDAGVRIVGGASRGGGNKKHSFRLAFKSQYGPKKLDFPVFGDDAVDSFDTFTLRAGFNDVWPNSGGGTTYLQDRWAADSQLAAGGLAGHGNFVHLYVNGLYWGLYNPVERPDDSFAASYLGGEKEDYDVYTQGGLDEGNATAWNLLHSLANDAAANYAAIGELLDIPAFCDYFIVNHYANNGDWPHNNWRATYNREGDGKWRFHSWDAEFGLRNINGNNVDSFGGPPGSLYQKLRNAPQFVSDFADRLHRLLFNDGALTLEANLAWLDEVEAEIHDAIVGESARWGDGYNDFAGANMRDSQWVPRISWLRGSFFPARSSVTSGLGSSVLQQYKNVGLYPDVVAPSFNINGSYLHGGIIDLGGELTIDAPAGTIYYTLDGTDPKSGGTLYSGPVALNEGGNVKSRVYHNGVWSALNDATYYVDVSADIRVTEVMYNPSAPTRDEIDSGYTDAGDFEYIEITNISADTLPLTGLRFSNGIDFTFGAMSIDPGEHVVVVSNLAAFDERYDVAGNGISVAGEYGTGLVSGTRLADAGENLELAAPVVAENILDFSYSDGWYDHTDGEGFSLTIRNPEGSLDLWDEADGWRASAAPGGSPGYADSLVNPGSVVVHEVLAHTDSAGGDVIELRNMSGSPVDVSGWWLSDQKTDEFGVEVLTKYQIPTLPPIPAKEYLVLHEVPHFGGAFALSEHGDDVYLSSDAAGVAGGYREHVDFGGSPNGVSIGLYTKSTGGTDFTLLRIPFIGSGNSVPYFEDLVINEVMYHPPKATRDEIDAGFINDADFEFVEIYNKSDTTTHTLSEFYIGDGIGFTFGWYDADNAGNESWTLEPGATAAWTTDALAAGPNSYEVFARWDLLDADGAARNLDGQAAYSITHDGGTTAVVRDQKPEDDDEGPDYMDPSGWVSLGTYYFDGNGQVVLTRGTNDPDNWTIADQVKFVRAGHSDVILDNPTLDSWNTANGPATLAPGEYAVIVSNRDAFNCRYNYPRIAGQNDVTIAGQYTGNLSDSGEKVKLLRAGTPDPSGLIPYYRIDYVNYGDSSPWPDEPDGDGPSLSRNDPYGPNIPFPYGNDPGSWFAGAMHGSPGEANGPADLTGPTVPRNLAAQVGAPFTQVELTWTASQDLDTHVDHYIIYRNDGNIGTSRSLSYTDTGAQSLIPYSYEVRAVNRDGTRSDRSTAAEITIPGITTHGTPTDTQIVLVFNEPLAEASAENLSNYTFAGGTLSGAALEADNVTVTLTTATMTPGQGYTLTVGGLSTVSGTLVPPGQKVSFLYGQTIGSNAPTVANAIANVNVNEDAVDMVLDLESAPVFTDSDPGDTLTYSVTGNTNTSVVRANIAAGELHLSYIADRNGTATITVRATDLSGASVEDAFTVTVASIGDTPRLAAEISNFTVNEDADDTVLDLGGVFYDPDVFYYDPGIPGDDDILTLTVAGNTNPSLVTPTFNGNELTLSYVADRNGTANITVRATDSDGNPLEDTFTVTVDPVNDAPVATGGLADVVVDENDGPTVLNLAAAFGDADIATDGDSLTFTVTGNTNPSLVDTSVLGTLSYAANQYGTAEITIRATDLAAGAWAEDTFTLGVASDGTATVDQVLAGASSWSAAFSDYLDAQGLGHPTLSHPGYAIPGGGNQLDTLPWNNLDTVVISFSKGVSIVSGDLALTGVNAGLYAIGGFKYNPSTFTATWTLAAPIGADKLLIDLSDSVNSDGAALDGEWTDEVSGFPSGNGAAGGDFQFRFNVLPGDTDRNGTTELADGSGISTRMFARAGIGNYGAIHDINGSGRIDFFDWMIVRANLGASLPPGSPVAPANAPSAALATAPETALQAPDEPIAAAAAPVVTVVSQPIRPLRQAQGKQAQGKPLDDNDASDDSTAATTPTPAVDLLVESPSAGSYISGAQAISAGLPATTLYRAATGEYDLWPLGYDQATDLGFGILDLELKTLWPEIWDLAVS